MASTNTTRRGMLGAMAVAPMVIAAPAALAQPNRHAEWMIERDHAWRAANERGIPCEECDRRTDALASIENRILETAAGNADEAKVKLRLMADLYRDGMLLDETTGSAVLNDALRWWS